MQNGFDSCLSAQQHNGKLITIDDSTTTLPDFAADDFAAQRTNTESTLTIEDGSTGFDTEGPPAKRRRLTDSTTPQRSSSRPASPPWKKITVDGPTTYFEEGKRKSARTNVVPLTVQLQSSKRRTRAAIHQSNNIKSKYGGGSLSKPSPLAMSATSDQLRDKHNQSYSHSRSQTAKKPTTRFASQVDASTSTTPTTSTKRPYNRKAKIVSPGSPSPQPQSASPEGKRRLGRPPKRRTIIEDEKEMVTGGLQSEHQRIDHNCDESDLDEDEDDEDDMEDIPIDPNLKPQRLKFKVHMPTLTAQHPRHLTPRKKFSSLQEWLHHDDWHDDYEVAHLTDKEIQKEARIRLRISEAAKPGGVLDPTRCSIYDEEPEELPSRQYSRHDHLLAHVENFHKLLNQEHRRHLRHAKDLARACQARWREIQPQSEEEIRQEQQESAQAVVMATMQQCLRDLIAKWDLLRAEVSKWRLQKWEEEQEKLGKQALNKVIEHSTQLLDARIRKDSADGSDDDDSGSEPGTGSQAESDEQNMSSEAESEEEGQEVVEGAIKDEDLTVDELRRKYNTQPTQDLDRPPDYIGNDDEFSVVNSSEAMELDGESPSLPKGINFDNVAIRAKISQIEAEDVKNSILSESDDSTDMDDDMGDSDGDESGSSDDGEVDDGEDDDDDDDNRDGLLGFMSRKDLDELETTNEAGIDSFMQLQDELPFQSMHMLDDASDEEIEEVSLIPDAAQVQTPSASNSEAPSIAFLKDPEKPGPERFSGLRESSTAEEVTSKALHVDEITNINDTVGIDMAMDVDPDPGSLPVTPVSAKPLKTAVPHLLRATLREYQHYGLDWLAGLYSNGTNGILADEMGLGKTIQTISLLAHLAIEHEVWGPHLVVVPTSVILNWEMEFKKFLPAFKILTYFGSQEERRQKRKGWLDDDKWNVVITSYQLVLKDEVSFKKRGWHYLVLDEAHNIKNFRSQRWQALLNFRTHSRLLLTGTPLQNNLTELWSLMFFLMPSDGTETGIPGFADLQEFTSWFKKPVDQILEQGRDTMDDEAKELVKRLHSVLRPYLLRRLKADVEKQMPGKYEHVVYCKLSKRQRYLYDGFMSRAQTRETLARGNYLSIINCLMQLRKVCNHPDLFETRQIVTSFAMPRSAVADYEIKELLVRRRLLQEDGMQQVSLDVTNLLPGANGPISALDTIQKSRLGALGRLRQLVGYQLPRIIPKMHHDGSSIRSTLAFMENDARIAAMDDLRHRAYLTSLRSQRRPLYSHGLVERIQVGIKTLPIPSKPKMRIDHSDWYSNLSPAIEDMVATLPRRYELMYSTIQKFSCVTPAVVAPGLNELTLSRPGIQVIREAQKHYPEDAFHEPRMRQSIAFPDKRLLQYDCGKLQRLDTLLRTLQAGGHRALIFTQMTKVLDILEQFLNIHGHLYLRLDGSTKIEERQVLTERFNNDSRILAFILSSRSGGLGINLTGADTVIFYDLDWNPAMDKQCQDRCHRIGQTRDVHIYRFVSEYTIETNILRKANQKRMLDDVIIQDGDFTTDYFNKPTARDPFEDNTMHEADAEASAAFDRVLGNGPNSVPEQVSGKIFEQAEDKEDVAAAQVAEKEMVHVDEADFSERPTPGENTSNNTPKPSRPLTPHGNLPSTPRLAIEGALQGDDDSGYKYGTVVPRTDMSVGIFAEKEPIGVDRYIVEFWENELRDVPVEPPGDKNKKRKKKGGEHRLKR